MGFCTGAGVGAGCGLRAAGWWTVGSVFGRMGWHASAAEGEGDAVEDGVEGEDGANDGEEGEEDLGGLAHVAAARMAVASLLCFSAVRLILLCLVALVVVNW